MFLFSASRLWNNLVKKNRHVHLACYCIKNKSMNTNKAGNSHLISLYIIFQILLAGYKHKQPSKSEISPSDSAAKIVNVLKASSIVVKNRRKKLAAFFFTYLMIGWNGNHNISTMLRKILCIIATWKTNYCNCGAISENVYFCLLNLNINRYVIQRNRTTWIAERHQ